MAKETTNHKNSGNLGFENDLWRAADALRSNMDAAEYKHVVLGLIFLKYISDAFEEQHVKLDADRKNGADPEDADEYHACNMFVQSVEFVNAHATGNGNAGKAKADISIFGQESNHITWKLAKLIWANLEDFGYGK